MIRIILDVFFIKCWDTHADTIDTISPSLAEKVADIAEKLALPLTSFICFMENSVTYIFQCIATIKAQSLTV